MLYKSVQFACVAGAVAYSPAAPSKVSSSKVARSTVVEMAKKSVGDLTEAELKGKKVLVRCDLNVPLDGKTITDDTRIRASIPTVEYLVKNGAKVLLSSHLGRPKDGPEDKFSLGPVAPRLSELLGKEVVMAPDCIGDAVAEKVNAMADGDVLLLENTRFYKEEEKNVPESNLYLSDRKLISLDTQLIKMLYKSVQFACVAGAVAYSPAISSSKVSSSKVARTTVVEMAKKSVGDLNEADLKGKRVLVRCDLNVPLDGKTITDDTRIRASIPTVEYLVKNGAKVLLSSHLGRPKDGPEDKFSLGPVAPRLSELLGKDVVMAPDCIGDAVTEKVNAMADGDVLLLENTRFYKEEEKNVPEFAEKLAANADLFVNDAFGTAHRAHGSTEGVTKYLDTSVAGFLLQKELDYLDGAVSEPKRPFAAIVGGSKVSSKIGVIESLMEKVDKIVIGGGMVFTFLKARGLETGSSLVEEDQLDLAKKLETIAAEKGIDFILPTDVIVADKFAADAATQTVSVENIPEGWMGLDNGPASTADIVEKLSDCKTVIWNGPPFAAIVGGSKVSSKIGVIESLMEKVDKIVIGGGMVFTFLKARGLETGSSLVEEDQLDLAKKLETIAAEKGIDFILPTDVIVADKFAADAATQTVSVENIPEGWMGLDNGPASTADIVEKLSDCKTVIWNGEGWMGLDNGPASTADIVEKLSDCKTVIWNGPMGVFEFEAFSKGTFAVADSLAELTGKGCTTIIGGGDSVAAVEKAGLAEKMSHISTGGGASLELLEGKVLPGVAALQEA
eukprot:CAMPEP_0174754416 /NCGR_PEP_ID=MMETSP1094-20130205/105710_1 /TAXON_ID=156173 /ORGANISM="Chrysochromulina brevifilum, Strain UTEX LB 985" /LENGTH=787 /DNA_ID=CAMNT_0015960281 /DNA_START=35 /DNA_END=2399 /DNA_ORIENTATION=-